MSGDEDAVAGDDRPASLPVPVPTDPWLPGLLVADEVEAARRYVEAAMAPATLRAYANDWELYTRWCADRGLEPLPSAPAQVATFLAHQAELGLAVATIERRLAAIGHHHRRARFPAPTAMADALAIEQTLRGIRRTHGSAPKRKRAATHDLVRAILDAIPEAGARNLRDRALIAFGLASAMRRSELAALRLEHLTRAEDGVRVLIPKSKTDQEGEGRTIAVPRGLRIRPLALLEAWLAAGGITEGFVFRRMRKGDRVTGTAMSGEAVALVLKQRAAAVGLDAAEFGAHSLRAGFLTSAAATGASLFKMRDQSRHESLDVLAGYVRDVDLFKDHAGAGFL